MDDPKPDMVVHSNKMKNWACNVSLAWNNSVPDQ